MPDGRLMPEHEEDGPGVYQWRRKRVWQALIAPNWGAIHLSGPVFWLPALIQKILLRTDADLLLISKLEKNHIPAQNNRVFQRSGTW